MKKCLLSISAILFLSVNSFTYGYVWTQKANFTGGNRAGACAFSINNLGYVTCGISQTGFGFVAHNDLWQYDPQVDTWTQLASLPASGRSSASGFTINGMGYVCLGFDLSIFLNDMWQYNPVSNTWLQKTNFPGGVRYTAASFVIGNNAYVGMGKSGGYYSDFYSYDAVSDTWSQVASIGGSIRQNGRGFSIGNYGYVVGGAYDPNGNYFDLWQYDPAGDTWMQKTSYPGLGCYAACAFVLNGIAYVGTGSTQVSLPNTYDDFYSYDPVSDTWTVAPSFGGGIRNSTVSFSIGNKAYAGLGSTGIYPSGIYQQDWWEFSSPVGIEVMGAPSAASVTVLPEEILFHFNKPLPELSNLKFYNAEGKEIKSFVISKNTETFSLPFHSVSSGAYFYTLFTGKKGVCSGKFSVLK